jgi:hypothetical protein
LFRSGPPRSISLRDAGLVPPGGIELVMILTLVARKSRFHEAKEAFPHNPASIRMYTHPL